MYWYLVVRTRKWILRPKNNIANMSLMLMSFQLNEDLKSVDKEFSVNKYLCMCFYCHELLS